MFVPLEAEHHVARADAGDAKISVHAYDRRVPEGARLGIPARVEGRIEMMAMAGDLDRGDDRLGGEGGRRERLGHERLRRRDYPLREEQGRPGNRIRSRYFA